MNPHDHDPWIEGDDCDLPENPSCRRDNLIVSVEDPDASCYKAPAIRTARKGYECGECGRAIKPGEDYVDSRWRYGRGYPWAERRCLGCGTVSDAEMRVLEHEEILNSMSDADWGF